MYKSNHYLPSHVDGPEMVRGRHHHGAEGEGMGNLEIGRDPFGQISLAPLEKLLCQRHI